MAEFLADISRLIGYRCCLPVLVAAVSQADALCGRLEKLLHIRASLNEVNFVKSGHLASIPGYLDRLEACVDVKINLQLNLLIDIRRCVNQCRCIEDDRDYINSKAKRDAISHYSSMIEESLVSPHSLAEAAFDAEYILTQISALLNSRSPVCTQWTEIKHFVDQVKYDILEVRDLLNKLTASVGGVSLARLVGHQWSPVWFASASRTAPSHR